MTQEEAEKVIDEICDWHTRGSRWAFAKLLLQLVNEYNIPLNDAEEMLTDAYFAVSAEYGN